MKISCAIVDDEQPARQLLENFTSRVPNLELVGSYKSPLEVVSVIGEGKVGLLFLDIQMQDMKGTDFLRTLTNGPEVILTTAYADYALEGYDLNVSDYLLKPFSFERFLQAVNKCTEVLELKKKSGGNDKKVLKIKTDRKVYMLEKEEILYIEGLKEYVSFYTKAGERIISLESMKNLEESLKDDFLRTHRSYIVRVDQVKYMEGNSVVIGEKRIPIGLSYKERVLKRFEI